jgi:protein-L-isoaspartate(D-aspartate) O-methyltransferase
MGMPRTREGLARLIERERLQDRRIIDAFRAIDRADFVPDKFRHDAYRDRPVGIPEDQTTSQPSLIARMIDVAAPAADDNVLEVGAGYGFQTALLASVAARVTAIEMWPSLAKAATENLRRAGIRNAEVMVGDGWAGYKDNAPYDVIIVSAAADEVPDALEEQLTEGGRMVIPVRETTGDNVYLFLKRDGGLKLDRMVTPARFVPLVRKSGGNE